MFTPPNLPIERGGANLSFIQFNLVSELITFRNWFAEFDAEIWDRQFEEDVATGKLNALAEQARKHLREGRCTDL